MRKILATMLAICLLMGVNGVAEEWTADAFAIAVLDDLANGRWEDVFARSDTAMQAALGSADGYKALWAQLTDMMGAFAEASAEKSVQQGGFTLVHVRCAFESMDAALMIVVNEQRQLSGISVLSVTAKSTEEAVLGEFVEEAIQLRPGAVDATDGLLTLPEGSGPFPAVIMLHGSGSADMDEAVFANAPFRDLARGLAELGVASLRYDKFTYAHPDLIGADFTVEKEYVRDALDAARILLADARIGEIYVLGYSMGAMLAPRVMTALQSEAGDRLAGGVLLAGTPLHLWEVQHRQNLDAIAKLSGDEKAAAEALVAAELEKFGALSQLTGEQLMAETLFGIPAYYQVEEMSIDPVESALALGLRLFIAQGAKDWQTRPENGIELWKAQLPEGFDATYHLYEDMNHMLSDMEGESTGTPSDYMDAGARVSAELIGDIAQWISSKG
ncbi:MAG: alpha/beta fold hydrolase [Clostridiales bacterium]|nr:alpha/beta fold hydrolase [Clostridiales bacterium]